MTLFSITFFLLLLAHLLGDVIFPSYRLSLLKRDSRIPSRLLGIGGHAVIHACFAALLLFAGGGLWVKGACLVFVLHFAIDFGHSRIDIALYGPGHVFVKRSEFLRWISGKGDNPEKMNLKNLRTWFLTLFFDQVAHLVSLFFIANLL